ncbi:hypothetical protein DPMN_072925 [Dreissena polymorpha]|uniref:Uncharacterized protein n=1 Tax=Dreissena polymorpha TaxID=45954 RepID=A0A9D4HA44_DREPO|nr:hypothetical protein DPMN_072925 [Dreissena polymorpha]
MYSAIPKVWREDSPKNVTLTEKNNSLVELHIPTITFIAILMDVGVLGNMRMSMYIPSSTYRRHTARSFYGWVG